MAGELTIWCNAKFPDTATTQLVNGVKPHRLLIDDDRAANISVGGPSPLLEGASVAFGQPDPGQVMELPGLKWVHLTSAGYTRYDRDDLRKALSARGAMLTNSSSVFDEPCAQHLLAFMLGHARQLPQSMADQLGGHVWRHEDRRTQTRLLLPGQTVLLLGFGAIARRLVELLAPFHMNVIAVRRHVRGDEPVPTHRVSDMTSLLPMADHVVNVLPSSPSTDGLVDGRVFDSMKHGAAFYNIGRGTTVDQSALISALNEGRVGAAYLDVTDPEPLPPDHPLWAAPNCFITPHIAGGHAEEFPNLVAHFLRNLRRFDAGEALADRVV
jgi:phosphoglycerate dehydrogenase-like enzyme